MVDAAFRQQAEGTRVTIGCLASHAGFQVLEFIHLQDIQDLEIPEELNLDHLKAEKPNLVIVDELAAENLPGTRHPRRYQDVLELLDEGIDVYSTLDISQLESQRDAPWQCSSRQNRLTIPDSLFDQAAVIEFVDIPPHELIQRLKQIPYYQVTYTPRELETCFSVERLNLSREAALRRVAGRVHREFEDKKIQEGSLPTAPLQNRILVCVSSHPLAERLVRAGRRMADELSAGWVVLYVETPERVSSSYPYTEQLEKTLALATELGAEVVKISGHRVASTVLEYSRSHEITRIILGNPRRTWWQDLFRTNLVDQIIRHSGLIDIYVINDERGVVQPGVISSLHRSTPWKPYSLALLFVAAATGIGYLLHTMIDPANLVMIYLLVVVLTAIYLGRGPSILASVLSAISFDFFLIEPKLSLTIDDTQYVISLLGLLATSLMVSNLASTIQSQVKESRLREARSSALVSLSRSLTGAVDFQTVYQSVIQQAQSTFECEVALYSAELIPAEIVAHTPAYHPEQGEEKIVDWVLGQNQPAGISTATYPNVHTHYRPLTSSQQIQGVLCLQFLQKEYYLSTEQSQILDAFTGMAAVAIDKVRLLEQKNRNQLSLEKEKLQTALLNSISHDLRTPLASITGVLSTLRETDEDENKPLSAGMRKELIDTGWEEANRLNQLVGNLLDMTRLEAGAVHLKLVEVDLLEVIESVRHRMKEFLEPYHLVIRVPENLPLVTMDQTLMEQVLVNLLDNSIKYSPSGGTITITARIDTSNLWISISDEGRGIPPDELPFIFEKFYRGSTHERINGTGLGLAICKGLVEIHGGKITAANYPGGGVVIEFNLPQPVSLEFSEE